MKNKTVVGLYVLSLGWLLFSAIRNRDEGLGRVQRHLRVEDNIVSESSLITTIFSLKTSELSAGHRNQGRNIQLDTPEKTLDPGSGSKELAHGNPSLLFKLTTSEKLTEINITGSEAPPSRSSSNMTAQVSEAFAYVRSFKLLKRRLGFFHIPKTAGTAVEVAAWKRKLAWGSCRFSHPRKRHSCMYPLGADWPEHIGWWHLPRQFFPLLTIDPYQGEELFAIVRDSYDRMVSEFYYICTLQVYSWRPNQCDRRRLFDRKYMNRWLRKKLINAATSRRWSGYLRDNGHFTPQYEFIVGPNEVRIVDHVITLESIGATFHHLMRAFGQRRVQLEKRNAVGAQTRTSESHLGVRDLDNSTLALINEKFSEDFALVIPAIQYKASSEFITKNDTAGRIVGVS